MKHLFLTLILALCVAIGAEARTYVMCVGVSRYQNSQNNLSQTTKDVKQFKDVMEGHTKNITILTSQYANKANIMEKLRAICNRAGSSDQIIFFYSGHGYPGGMAVYDDLLSYQDFNDVLSTSQAGAIICLIDACHAGSVNSVRQTESAYKAPEAKNILYMLACRADEYSTESPWIGHGFFAQGLLKGLRGKADANLDKKITVMELFKYVYNDVQHTTSKMSRSQHPQLIGSKDIADTVIIDWN